VTPDSGGEKRYNNIRRRKYLTVALRTPIEVATRIGRLSAVPLSGNFGLMQDIPNTNSEIADVLLGGA